MAKLSVEAIEATYGITSREIRNAISDGHLEAERNHGSWLVSEKSLEAAISQGVLKNRKQAV
ncbi:hypothetical protein D3C87_2012560 [compost metagenome]